MYLLESLYTWAGTAEEHHAKTSVEHARGLKPRVAGLEWKLWVQAVDDTTAGGYYYLFHTEADSRRFEEQTLRSLAQIEGAIDPRTRLFVVRDDMSAVTGALAAARPE